MPRPRHNRRSGLVALTAAAMMLAVTAAGAGAHSHVVNKDTEQEQVIGNGQNHPAFVYDPASDTWVSCESHTLLPGFGPAWYGLETAHHGPDSGAPGKGDGCYAADASPVTEEDDVNPAID